MQNQIHFDDDLDVLSSVNNFVSPDFRLIDELREPNGDREIVFEMFLTSLSFKVVLAPAFRASRAIARHLNVIIDRHRSMWIE